jgi:hypothetical protein
LDIGLKGNTADPYQLFQRREGCGITPEPLGSIGDWYERFVQLSDEDVAELLDRVLLIKQSVPEL